MMKDEFGRPLGRPFFLSRRENNYRLAGCSASHSSRVEINFLLQRARRCLVLQDLSCGEWLELLY